MKTYKCCIKSAGVFQHVTVQAHNPAEAWRLATPMSGRVLRVEEMRPAPAPAPVDIPQSITPETEEAALAPVETRDPEPEKRDGFDFFKRRKGRPKK